MAEQIGKRVTVRDEGDRLVITIGHKPSWLRIVIPLFCLGMCVPAVISLSDLPPLDTHHGLFAFLFGLASAAFMCVWFTVVLSVGIWALFGGQVVEVDASSLVLRRRGSLSGSRRRIYSLSSIRNLRYDPAPEAAGPGWSRDPYSGNLAFDYGPQTIAFGLDLDEREAAELLRTITQRFRLPEEAEPPRVSPLAATDAAALPLPHPRAIITDDGERLSIVLPAVRRWSSIVFVTVWLCGWLFGEIAVPWFFLYGGVGWKVKGFLALWWVLWTWGGLATIYSWGWMLFGREVVTVDHYALLLERIAPFLPRSVRFDLEEVRNLRVSPAGRRGLAPCWRFSVGAIAFDSGTSTYRFGLELDEPEARNIVQRMKRRFPALASRVAEEDSPPA